LDSISVKKSELTEITGMDETIVNSICTL